MDIRAIYTQGLAQNKEILETLKKRGLQFSIFRLVLFFLLFFFCLYMTTSMAWYIGTGAVILSILLFSSFVIIHNRLKYKIKLRAGLVRVNSEELEALDFSYGHFRNGSDFFNQEHPYSSDLDLFGERSLFQYMNRASTFFGQKKLAKALNGKSSVDTIIQRQEASKELMDQLEWSQTYRAHGLYCEDDKAHLKSLEDWLGEQPKILNSPFRHFVFIAPVFTILSILLLFNTFPAYWPLVFFLPVLWALKKTKSSIDDIHFKTTHSQKIFEVYKHLFAHIEEGSFESALAQESKNKLVQQGERASLVIKKMEYILSQLNVRYNFFVVFLNLFGAWDIYWALRLEKWKIRYRDFIPAYFGALGDMEMLISFSTLALNNPEWTWPELSQEEKLLMLDVGHPLLPSSQRVCNDFDSLIDGHIKLLTGSNMSGKSTFLRTIGLNIVLANSGAPVCAEKMRTPIFNLITSMRNADSLQDSTSSFYAELKRLKQVINLVKSEERVFFLLDEILKGTNSQDRHVGSRALIEQLIRDRGTGVVATHDLDLGSMAAQSEGHMENICLEVQIQGNQLVFDYKLREGVCQNLNASVLMRNMGIEM